MAVSIMSSSRVWRQKHDRNCERIKENMYLSKKTVLKNKLYFLLYTSLFTYSQNTTIYYEYLWYFCKKVKLHNFDPLQKKFNNLTTVLCFQFLLVPLQGHHIGFLPGEPCSKIYLYLISKAFKMALQLPYLHTFRRSGYTFS